MTAAALGVRTLAAIGVVAGALLLGRPQRALDGVDPAFPRNARPLVRLLGARLVAQHGALLLRPAPGPVTTAAAVELLHAASMLPFLASPRYGRAARVSGAVALTTAALLRAAGPRSQGR